MQVANFAQVMKAVHKAYALVTPARNEQDFIEFTIQSVTAQTVKPVTWVIVSDRSTDRTDEIITHYARKYSFINFVRNDTPSERNTAAKVRAIRLGLQAIANTEYAYFGNLDADVSFGETYFETLLTKFESDPSLGLIGGWIFQKEKSGRAVKVNANRRSVAGAVQFFRKECFDQIGGYQAIPGGMEDGIAEITARYYGWGTCSFLHLPVLHHRELGIVGRTVYRARFISGLTEYVVGYGWSYHVIRALSRALEKPYLLGALLIISGYTYGLLSRRAKAVPKSIIDFIRREQRTKVIALLRGERESTSEKILYKS
jgi:biofilm PGA synthesis N-glycosyltransferase PgaC